MTPKTEYDKIRKREQAPKDPRDAVIDRQAEEIRGMREDFLELLKAAERIKHWHDTHNNGMIVSAESVRDLWAATEDARAALNPTLKEHLNA